MEKITAYRDSNGHLHDCYGQAVKAQADIIGQALDDLIGDTKRTRITKAEHYRLAMGTMKSKNFKANVIKLCNAVESEDWEEIQSYLMKSKWFNV